METLRGSNHAALIPARLLHGRDVDWAALTELCRSGHDRDRIWLIPGLDWFSGDVGRDRNSRNGSGRRVGCRPVPEWMATGRVAACSPAG